MVPFGGWSMPMHYPDGILAEHRRTRTEVTVFDTSHMGEFLVEGDAVSLEPLVTQRVGDMAEGECRYAMMLTPRGGVLDDLLIYRRGERSWMLVVNAATTERDAAHIRAAIEGDMEFTDVSRATAKLDVQGPASRDSMAAWIPGIETLGYYRFLETEVDGRRCLVSRTGYTGELGYEIYAETDAVEGIWDRLLAAGAAPAGLGARDILRLEMGYSLYGHELTEEVSPLEAGLERFLSWDKDFIGREALRRQKASGRYRRSVCLVSEDRRAPRAGQGIFTGEGRRIGEVTSGTFSPVLKRGLGLGRVEEAAFAVEGRDLWFGDAARRHPARAARRPVYTEGSLRK